MRRRTLKTLRQGNVSWRETSSRKEKSQLPTNSGNGEAHARFAKADGSGAGGRRDRRTAEWVWWWGWSWQQFSFDAADLHAFCTRTKFWRGLTIQLYIRDSPLRVYI